MGIWQVPIGEKYRHLSTAVSYVKVSRDNFPRQTGVVIYHAFNSSLFCTIEGEKYDTLLRHNYTILYRQIIPSYKHQHIY